MISTPYIQLLRVALGTATQLDAPFTQKQWEEVLEESVRQSVLGIAWQGMLQLPEEQRPDSDTIASFFGLVTMIQEANKKADITASKVEQRFAQDNIKACIIKGQGAAHLYPHPDFRQTGDIDVWVNCGRERTLDYVRKITHKERVEARIHHVKFIRVNGIPVEVHYWPMFMYSFRAQKVFEKFCTEHMEEQMNNAVNDLFHTPTPSFNAVFMLVHITRHLLEEGIGMRQLIDYFYVMKALPANRSDIVKQAHALGLSSMLEAVMYVMQEAFGMESKDLIVPADKQLGRILMDEIAQTGAFGLFDQRNLSWKHGSKIHLFFGKLAHNLSLFKLCPEEIVFAPLFRIWHYCWRKKNRYL